MARQRRWRGARIIARGGTRMRTRWRGISRMASRAYALAHLLRAYLLRNAARVAHGARAARTAGAASA